MEKIKTGLAAFGMSGQIFHAPFISTNPAHPKQRALQNCAQYARQYALRVYTESTGGRKKCDCRKTFHGNSRARTGISRPRSVQRPGYKRISEQALGFGFPYSSGNTEKRAVGTSC